MGKTNGISRRGFLALGTSGLAAGCVPSVKPRPLVSESKTPPESTPGLPVLYRTFCRECPAACGVTARTRDGRVVKLEGNPDSPIGRGALCARGQAAVQGLYAPDRFRSPLQRASSGQLEPVAWDAAEQAFVKGLSHASADEIRWVTRPEPGVTGTVQKQFLKSLHVPPEHRLVFDVFDPIAVRAANQRLYGRPTLPGFDLARARCVVSFGADFLETWISPVELTAGFAAGRGWMGDQRTTFTWVGPRLSLTGVSADIWLEARPDTEAWLAIALLRWLVDPANQVRDLSADAPAVFDALRLVTPPNLDWAMVERETGIPPVRAAHLAMELADRRPSAVLGPGLANSGRRATDLAVLTMLINHVLRNVGVTVDCDLDPLRDPPSPFAELQKLADDMRHGRVKVLVSSHADLLSQLPESLDISAGLDKVQFIAAFATRPDATTARASLILPEHHWLEGWADASPRVGVLALGQPAMTPLYDTRPAAQVCLDAATRLFGANRAGQSFESMLRASVVAAAREGGVFEEDAESTWRAACERGGVFWSVHPAVPDLQVPELGLSEPQHVLPPEHLERLDTIVFPTVLRPGHEQDAFSWLGEVPDPVSTVSWVTWLEMSPQMASRLGVKEGNLVKLKTAGPSVEVPAHIYPGLAEDTLAMPYGPAAMALMPGTSDKTSGGLAWLSIKATPIKTSRKIAPVTATQVPYRKSDFRLPTVSDRHPRLPKLPPPAELYPTPKHPVHRWAMVVDLDRCTGCQACTVACYAENNIPVLGPLAASKGRSLAWIGTQSYWSEDTGAKRLDLLLLLCQHCTNAPCEPVCPVYATYHTSDGLNAQVYPRCVGTRYCANNCPYQVRVFNWVQPSFPEPLNLQLNPDVTVRSKGVVEKCTFCVQRIRQAEVASRASGRPLLERDVIPACVQTCAAGALTFGDANDPHSRIARLRASGRAFALLGQLNTQPAITYLARIREEEP